MEHSRPVVNRIIQATAIVAILAVAVRGLGFVEKLLLAYFFGTGMQVDAYLVAYSLPFSAYIVLRDVVAPAFVPVFIQTGSRSEPDAWRLFRGVATWLLLLLGLSTVAGILAARPLVSLAAPGFSGEQQALAVRLTRLAMPALLLLGLSTLTTAALQARKRFALPAAGEAGFRFGPIPAFLALGRVEGLVIGVIAGALAKLSLESIGLWWRTGRATGTPQVRALLPALDPGFPPLRRVARLAAPLLAGLSLSLFVGPLVDNAFASRAVEVGGVSALAYARKIGETLTSILPYTLGLVLFPFSAEMAARRDQEATAGTLVSAIRAMALVLLPVMVGLILLREPFVRLLLQRGAFTAESTQLTAGPLLFYAMGLLSFALEIIVVRFFYARQDTLTPVLADVAAFALDVAIIVALMPSLGLGAIALATTIAKTVKVLTLLGLFARRVPAFRLARLVPFAGQTALASLAAAAALLAVLWAGPRLGLGDASSSFGGSRLITAFVEVAAGGLASGTAFVLAAYFLRVPEVRALWQRILAWRRPPPPPGEGE